MCCICDCKRDFPLSAWVEECCLAAVCIMRSSKRTKCISEFGELWYVKLSPPFFLARVSSPFFLFTKNPQKFRSAQAAKQTTFFPNQSLAPWLLRVTLLPNMHENVTVCLEAVCRVCKFKPQSEDQRQTETSSTWETFMAALIGQLHKLPANSRKTSPWSKAVKNHSLHLG